MGSIFRKQVALLLAVLPVIARENCFALHGGTAINLFVRDMPRLSVDINLTYIEKHDRETFFQTMRAALFRIELGIRKAIPRVHISPKYEAGKLFVSANGVTIKVEVSLVNRGCLTPPVVMELCDNAQRVFDAYCEMMVVPYGQLFGGKIIAALDRQHPRDLFDVQYLMENQEFLHDLKSGFLLFLICSERPMHELLQPNSLNLSAAFENQFKGMTMKPFSYAEFEATRELLFNSIHKNLLQDDYQFLLSVLSCDPDWALHDYQHFPAVKWKLKNLQILRSSNPEKFLVQYEALRMLMHEK